MAESTGEVGAVTDWGGAQWLIIFILVLRAIFGVARASGRMHLTGATELTWRGWCSNRFWDLTMVLILWWGGFW